MPSAIGIRVYQIVVHKNGDSDPKYFGSKSLEIETPQMITQFIKNYSDVVQNDDLERSWFFDARKDDKYGNSVGYVQYGTFGFESNFVDPKTKKTNYHRQRYDIEEIPLFYEFWCPTDRDYGLLALQSFGGRSCVGLVLDRLKKDFDANNPGFSLRYKKLLPNDSKGSLYSSAPVKKLTLIKHRAPSDYTDKYYQTDSHTGIDLEVSLKARRNGTLGQLAEIAGISSDGGPLVTYDGLEFDEAIAEIKVGRKTRKVGVFGSDSDAGVIDLTDEIERGPDGHPHFDAMETESSDILKDFYRMLPA